MKLPIILLVLGLMASSCLPRSTQKNITIIDIGHSDRIELGRLIRVINKHSPKILGLDFQLLADSLDKDSVLIKEISAMKNVVQVMHLYSSTGFYNEYDSVLVSRPKFGVKMHGFGGLTSEDSVFIPEQPLIQLYDDTDVYAFSYVVAEQSFGVKDKFKNTGYDEVSVELEDLGQNYNLIRNHEILAGKFDKKDLDNKIVLMGFIGDDDDYFYLDRSKSSKVNGVEIHAAIIGELINLK